MNTLFLPSTLSIDSSNSTEEHNHVSKFQNLKSYFYKQEKKKKKEITPMWKEVHHPVALLPTRPMSIRKILLHNNKEREWFLVSGFVVLFPLFCCFHLSIIGGYGVGTSGECHMRDADEVEKRSWCWALIRGRRHGQRSLP